jgi:phospholipid/cholesterol/gamma-HCH transport system substrate-binding protein
MKNTLETRLGVFFALAIVAAVLILEMIGVADFFRPGYSIYAHFKNAQDLKKGDLVKMAGVEIGRVKDIELTNDVAKVTMKIRKRQAEIKTDSKAIIKFTGLLGQNYMAITPGSSTNQIRATEGTSLATEEQPDLSGLMGQLGEVASGVKDFTKSLSADNFSQLLGPFIDFMKSNNSNLTATVQNMNTVSSQIAAGQGTVGKLIMDDALYTKAFAAVTTLQTTADEAKSLLNSAHVTINQINAGEGTLGKLAKDDSLYRETTGAMTNLHAILLKLNQGQGTVGKLINDDSFYRNAKLTLQKVDKATESLEDQGPLSVLGLAIGTLF